MVSFKSRLLYPWGKITQFPLDTALEAVWMTWGRERTLPYRDSNSALSVVETLTIPNVPSRLLW
jgi:hypothetical protein